jgi:hypothetical protein
MPPLPPPLVRITRLRGACGCEWEIVPEPLGRTQHHKRCHHGSYLAYATFHPSTLVLRPVSKP